MTIGNIAIALTLPVAIYSFMASAFAVRRPRMSRRAVNAAHIVTLLLTCACCVLIYAFVSDSFGLLYVRAYSSRSLPLIYKICGLWAGLDGSLLFWVWILAVCSSIVSFRGEGKTGDEGKIFSIIGAVLQAIVIFFMMMIVFEANPFASLPSVPMDGQGLNPLLQNFFMIIHPPALYIGYVGFAVPFAYAIALLVRGRGHGESDLPPPDWMRDVRLWTIISWLFLTIGNLLGAMWAYVELGWGGFWAWDPVENAGIMPWFTASAFLHSIIVQERRGMLKLWNLILLILTFLLTIFGTFITRSGVIRSVHSFSDITIGMYFIVFLSLAAIISVALLVMRRKELRGRGHLKALVSREGSFYTNSALFLLGLFAITWGTVMPLIVELLGGRKTEVAPAFFNQVMAPIAAALLFLTGICPLMSWGKMKKGLLRREFLWPAIFAHAVLFATVALGVKKLFPLLVAMGSAFTVATIAKEFWRSVRVVSSDSGSGLLRGLPALFRMAPRRYGGYVVHLGVVILMIGIAGSAYKGEYHVKLEKGVSQPAAGYELRLDSLEMVGGRDSEGVMAHVSISETGRDIGHLKPALFLHRNQQKPIAEVDLKIRPLKDIYLAMGSISGDGKQAEFVLTVTPLISFVWLGGIIMVIGTMLAILPARKRRLGVAAGQDEEAGLDIAFERAVQEDFI